MVASCLGSVLLWHNYTPSKRYPCALHRRWRRIARPGETWGTLYEPVTHRAAAAWRFLHVFMTRSQSRPAQRPRSLRAPIYRVCVGFASSMRTRMIAWWWRCLATQFWAALAWPMEMADLGDNRRGFAFSRSARPHCCMPLAHHCGASGFGMVTCVATSASCWCSPKSNCMCSRVSRGGNKDVPYCDLEVRADHPTIAAYGCNGPSLIIKAL